MSILCVLTACAVSSHSRELRVICSASLRRTTNAIRSSRRSLAARGSNQRNNGRSVSRRTTNATRSSRRSLAARGSNQRNNGRPVCIVLIGLNPDEDSRIEERTGDPRNAGWVDGSPGKIVALDHTNNHGLFYNSMIVK